jgi:2-dehydropantoate 2-reductase
VEQRGAGREKCDPISWASSSDMADDVCKILICGLGAVGGFYGSRLHRPPHAEVSVVCRSNYKAVAAGGVHLRTRAFGNYHFQPHAVFPSIESAANSGTVWDFVVVTTKALPDLHDDSSEIAPLIRSKRTSIVLIQNGVGVEEPHRRRFPDNVILSAVTVISAGQVEPGVVVQHRWTRISIGPYGGDDASRELQQRGTEATETFVRLLKEGGIKDAEAYDEAGLQLVRWHKIAIK